MDRTLYIYSLLAAGKPVSKQELADRFGVSERTIQRDFRDIRDLLENERPETGLDRTLMYHKEDGTVTIEPPIVASFTSSEAYAIAKILFESRSLSKKELDVLLTKLEQCCYPMADRRRMHDLILNERAMYVEPQHHQNLIHRIWELGTMVAQQQVVSVTYRRHSDGNTVVRLLKPVGILTDNSLLLPAGLFRRKGRKCHAQGNQAEIPHRIPPGPDSFVRSNGPAFYRSVCQAL
jgi:predicted DNA-binding transcriptional regulator YafY